MEHEYCDEHGCGTMHHMHEWPMQHGMGMDMIHMQDKMAMKMEMGGMVMQMADEAWADLIKEKMKKQLEKINGPAMDKIAAAGVDASMEKWKGKMMMMSKMKEEKDKLMKAFMP